MKVSQSWRSWVSFAFPQDQSESACWQQCGWFLSRAVNCFQAQGFMGKALWLNSYLSRLGSLASHRKDVNVGFLPPGFEVKRRDRELRVWKAGFRQWTRKSRTHQGGWTGAHRWHLTLLLSWAPPWSASSLPPSSSVIGCTGCAVSALRHRVLWSWIESFSVAAAVASDKWL